MREETKRRVAGGVVLALGAALILALLPYASGLLAAPVLYILWAGLHQRLGRRIGVRVAAATVVFLTFLLIVLPGIWLITLLVGQAQDAIESLSVSPVLLRLSDLYIGPLPVGSALADLGRNAVSWMGSNALSFLGTATRFVLSLVFTMFGLYYLLIHAGVAWAGITPYLPFTPERAAWLRERFIAVTYSTVIGTGLNAVVQATLTGIGLRVAGIPNAAFWAAVTAVLSILPLVGSGLVWGPASIGLLLTGNTVAGIALLLWGGLVISNIDNLLRPFIYRRYAHIHPMITVVGAVVGVEYFGLVGLVLGPLAIQYFFELVRAYPTETDPVQGRSVPPLPAPGQEDAPVPSLPGQTADVPPPSTPSPQ